MNRCLLSFCMLLGLAAPARADLILTFSQTTSTINVGDSINVDLVLTHSGAVVGTDIRTNGVVQADLEMLLDSAAVSATSFAFGAGFSDTGLSELANPLRPLLSADGSLSGVLAPSGATSSMTIGTVTFTGQTAGSSQITLVDGSFTDFLFVTDPMPSADIDSLIARGSPLSITVTAVPEPSACVLLGLGVCAIATTRRRSRKSNSGVA